MDTKRLIKLVVAIAITLIVWLLPDTAFGIPDLSVVEHRVIALFVFAALMWILEAIPIWTTSVLIIVLMLLTISDNMFAFLNYSADNAETFGKMVSYKAIMATFADPVVMLFLGGFALAMGVSKCGLDLFLARVMIKPFGHKSKNVLLGFMCITAFLSMFMSNTATAAMMLAIVGPILRQMVNAGRGRIAFALCIPIAANVGGIGTPIGTPPNAFAKGFLENSMGVQIGFGQWMIAMVPIVIVVLAVSWFFLVKLYPFAKKTIDIEIGDNLKLNRETIIVAVTFVVTVILWLLDSVTGLNSNIVAMIPLAVFAVTGVIGIKELKGLSWEVIWLVAGGIALGAALQGSGFADHLVHTIPFGEWSPLAVIFGAGLICYTMSTFMNNSATAALLIPILATVAVGMGDALVPFGGGVVMLVGIALSASLAMALPISTPPNAIAFSTGFLEQRDMVKVGLIVGVFGFVVGYLILFGATRLGIF